MKEHPILFSAPMILAILSGAKTQTRRVIKPQPTVNKFGCVLWTKNRADSQISSACPYGYCQPGPTGIHPQLWVRETWCAAYQDGAWGTLFRADETFALGKKKHPKGPYYHAKEFGTHIRWRPSIFMPRWASRITLEITDVRVQRLNEISDEDCIAEGIDFDEGTMHCANYLDLKDDERIGRWLGSKGSYASLWEKINGKGSWVENPFVWVLTFKKIDRA